MASLPSDTNKGQLISRINLNVGLIQQQKFESKGRHERKKIKKFCLLVKHLIKITCHEYNIPFGVILRGLQCEKYHEVCTGLQCTAVKQNDKQTEERRGGKVE